MKAQHVRLEKKPSAKSERIVVDEVFDDYKVRLLRAKYTAPPPCTNLAIENWGDERIQIIESWRVEAFVGYPTSIKLHEGDVFYISEGRKLTPKYKPIEREAARKRHLLVDFEQSREMARAEIKEMYAKLTMSNAVRKKSERDEIIRLVADAARSKE